MMRFATLIALVTMPTGLLLAGDAAVAEGNPCNSSAFYSSTPGFENAIWRMEVRVDEAAFIGPSVRDRLDHNWTNDAKRTYRWTSATMPLDAGTSTQLMAISAAVIAEGLPLLEGGDIVDVQVVSRGLDYGKGRASVIAQRICAARDKPCLDKLRRTQGGKVSGVEIKGGDQVVGQVKSSPVLANGSCSIPQDGCRGEVAAALQ
jgi:hypothetical protein